MVEYADASIIKPGYCSVSELVYKLLGKIHKPDSIEAMMLLMGIIYDTRRFLIANKDTMLTVNELLAIPGVDYRRAIELLRVEMDLSEKIARLKATQRLRFKRINEYIIAYTHVSAFEGSVARSLLDLGADIAIVGSSNDETRIIVRGRASTLKKLGIDLGKDVMPLVGAYLKGSGGGHEAAAAAIGKGRLFDAINYTVKLVEDRIQKALDMLSKNKVVR